MYTENPCRRATQTCTMHQNSYFIELFNIHLITSYIVMNNNNNNNNNNINNTKKINNNNKKKKKKNNNNNNNLYSKRVTKSNGKDLP